MIIPNEKNYNYKIWRSYWRIEDKENYDLTHTDHVIPFYTKEKLNNQYDINYLSDYLGELTMMYYIWKNNLKSEYICISQYRRIFYDINFDKVTDYIDSIRCVADYFECNTKEDVYERFRKSETYQYKQI